MYENIDVPFIVLNLDSITHNNYSDPIIYKILGSTHGIFSIEKSLLLINESPDREQRKQYVIKIRANILGSTIMNNIVVNINIQDLNDNQPKFKNDRNPIIASLPSHAKPGFHVTTVEVNNTYST